MADFLQALDVLLSWEGGYAKVKRDPGGETYCGISRINFPQWEGWPVIDDYKNHGGALKWNQIIAVIGLQDLVSDFYQSNFWNNQDYKDIANQDVASKIFQHNVNLGNRAIKLAQSAIGFGGNSIDGIIGPATLAALNAYEDTKTSIEFLGSYIVKLQKYYEDLIQEHPQLGIFQKEWFLRANTIGKRPA